MPGAQRFEEVGKRKRQTSHSINTPSPRLGKRCCPDDAISRHPDIVFNRRLRVPKDYCCCSSWKECDSAGRCRNGASPLGRIHDEDGATVDVFSSAQFGAERLLAYKTYEVGENDHALRELVAYELGIYPKMGGRYGTIALLDAFMTRHGDVCLVFPYISGDHTPTTAAAIQSYMRQLLEALRFLHAELGLMHRNVKRANCLWADGRLTLIDFECAVSPSPGAVFSRVGNNRYRAPEVAAAKRQATCDGGLLLYHPGCPGWLTPAAPYSFPSDIFSAGVCFAELLLRRRRLFADVDFLEEDYDRLRRRLHKWEEREGHHGRGDARRIFEPYLADELAAELLTPAAADLLARMLCFDPLRRVDAQEALRHEYFRQRFSDAGSRGDEESTAAASS